MNESSQPSQLYSHGISCVIPFPFRLQDLMAMASGKKKVPKQQQSSSSGEKTRNEDAAKV